ncbi:MAG TPA: hypothetical protein VFY67_09635 [Pyrinomonadaceae bacterium]|nr:hypothetical protein [Pyrinomonadaceae bacterium]
MGRLIDKRPKPFPLTIKNSLSFKHVRHARTKYTLPNAFSIGFLIPFKRLSPMDFSEEATRRSLPPKGMPDSLSPRLRIAVIAGWRNLVTSPPWIERVISPFDV